MRDIRVERENKFESLVNDGGEIGTLYLLHSKSPAWTLISYPLNPLPILYSLMMQTTLEGRRNRRKNSSWRLCADIIIESHRFFFFGLYQKWKRAQDLLLPGTTVSGSLSLWAMCRPRSQSPIHQVLISTMLRRRWLPRDLTDPFCSSCQKWSFSQLFSFA